MAFIALLDACVLVNAAVRDTLLRAVEADLYQLAISADILEETRRALEHNLGCTPQQTEYLLSEIQKAFDSAMVEGYDPLIPAMQNHEGDRHVLAAAVQAGAEVIVTFNTPHFRDDACKPHGAEAQKPDEFLVTLFEIDEALMAAILRQQAVSIHKGTDELLARLRQDVPIFAKRVEDSGLLACDRQVT